MSIYQFSVMDSQANPVSLSQYQGKVLLIVNTATGCGFTPQYEQLEQLYQTFHQQGFDILDFPCNQFGNQAPESNAEIQSFCQLNYHTSFTTFAKIDVNGPHASPLFEYLKKAKGGLLIKDIKWNFTKFLINQQGEVVKRYAPTTTPLAIKKEIQQLLANKKIT
ncbi:glutathione peroxidase [Enterococcus columbae]|nr:glutathione peroxidase [Enterococcus columbae]